MNGRRSVMVTTKSRSANAASPFRSGSQCRYAVSLVRAAHVLYRARHSETPLAGMRPSTMRSIADSKYKQGSSKKVGQRRPSHSASPPKSGGRSPERHSSVTPALRIRCPLRINSGSRRQVTVSLPHRPEIRLVENDRSSTAHVNPIATNARSTVASSGRDITSPFTSAYTLLVSQSGWFSHGTLSS